MSAILIGACGFIGTALAEPSEQAATLHAQHCESCHDSSVYQRADRVVHSLDALERQVQRCESGLGLTWFEEEVKDVAVYLNHHFYQFER
ncbi:MAG: cytochrome c [Sphingobacteriia bacterium]|nr:cytochrome c [Sphingobacteriia bacterium]NCC37971.1 cytochrome c [Gammaproteobacteria bacterium]